MMSSGERCYRSLPANHAGDIVCRLAGHGIAPQGVDRGVRRAKESQAQWGAQEGRAAQAPRDDRQRVAVAQDARGEVQGKVRGVVQREVERQSDLPAVGVASE